MRVKNLQCVDKTKQDIADMDANVTKPTTTISAKRESVEVESARTDISGPVNILQLMASEDIKISVPMHTILVKTMKNPTYGRH